MDGLRIELYQPSYLKDFVRLNTEWITTFFHLEKSDRVVLNDPEGYILNKGGQIFFAVNENGKVVGCCALIAHSRQEVYELAKMAVSPAYQGKGVGSLLGQAVLAYSRGNEYKKLFLEGNTKMRASISLYRKLGFLEIPRNGASYSRCNIMMELEL
jgi:N-acetylglutamate synthase and related acetyltransferases